MEETKNLLRESLTELQTLRGDLAKLRVDHSRLRKLVTLAGAAILLATVAVVLGWVAIQQNAKNVQDLACLIVGGTPNDPARPIIGEFRDKYDCPPFDPASVKKYGTPAPPRATVTATTTRPVPGPTQTVIRYVPGPTVTATRRVVVTRTVPPGQGRTVTKTAKPSCTVYLGGLCIVPAQQTAVTAAKIKHKGSP
jgi:hypothetical protein